MRPTPRTQPYRSGMPRMAGMVLDAMQQGRQPGQLNPADYERQRLQMAARQQMMGARPVAGINPPGQLAVDNFGLIPPNRGRGHNDLRALALQQLAQHMHGQPQATADVRGGFEQPQGGGWANPHVQRLLAQLLAGAGPARVA